MRGRIRLGLLGWFGDARMNSAGAAQQPSTVQMSVDGVRKRFGGVRAIDDVSIDILRGSILSIIGPNGAGKTSLLNMISGFYKPDTGRIALENRDITRQPAEQLSPRSAWRARSRTSLSSAASPCSTTSCSAATCACAPACLVACSTGAWLRREEIRHREICEEIIEFLKLQDLRKQPAAALPYGLRKRVELGRALALEPKVLLLDEPMGGMNQDEKEDIARYILDVNEERGITIVLIEHDMGVVMDISDHVVVLDRGRKIAEGAPGDVQNNPAVIAAYLGTSKSGAAVKLAEQPATDTLPKLLRRNMQTFGGQVGMREKDRGIWQSYSWRQCYEHVREFALGLAAAGFKRGDKLSVLGDNRPRLYWAQLAAQALGGMAVPLYQDSIASELAFVLQHAEVTIIVAEDQEQVDKVLSIAERPAQPAPSHLRGSSGHERLRPSSPQVLHRFGDDGARLRRSPSLATSNASWSSAAVATLR